MANTVKLEIVTTEKHFYRGEVELVIARTLNGDEGFMAGHTWGCKLLDIGELWIREPEAEANTYKLAAVGGGFIDIKESIIIFADSIEWKKDIDVDRANREKEAAEDWLRKNEESAPEYEVKRVRNEMKKCEMRLQVAEGGRMAAKH